jgi:drug/metabolite transporter (DMT)-like permease
MLAPELLAAMASGCWAVGTLFSATASSQMGAFAFTRWRLFFAMILLWGAAFYVGRWTELTWESVAWLSASSWIGILVGDTALFVCMNRLGPRRCGVLFATHALFSALFAWFFLGETLWGMTLMGSGVLVSGVMVAIVWGRREDETHRWENTQGTLWVGVAMGLLAAVGQAVATLMIKPLMSTGIDAVSASAVRATASFTAHLLLLWAGVGLSKLQSPLTLKNLMNTALSATVSMVIGMTLILQALKTGQANLVAIFSSIAPVLLLPLLWAVYRRQPAAGAWWGGAMTVVGSAMIMSSKV